MSYIVTVIVTVFVVMYLIAWGTPKGTFVVRGYKNGQLIFMKTYVDEYYLATAGDKFDRVEITEE